MGGKVIDVTLIYGELEVWIFEAKSLPNMDLASERVRRCLNFVGTCPCLFRKDPQTGKQATITSDPYVSVCLSGATVAQTRIIANSENPLWNEHFCIQVCHPIQKVEFHVKDDDVLGAQHIGVVEIPVENLMETDEMIDDWFPIMGENCAKPYPQLHLSIKLNYMDDSLQQKERICIDPFNGVPNTYFPVRKGGNVTLYQDAHVPEGQLPEIPLDDGKVYKQGQCWEDICHAILEAQNLIYIIGWSVYHPIRLVREPTKPLPTGGELTLGDLLKYKSQEGVRVVLLIWDDKTSHDKFLLKTVQS